MTSAFRLRDLKKAVARASMGDGLLPKISPARGDETRRRDGMAPLLAHLIICRAARRNIIQLGHAPLGFRGGAARKRGEERLKRSFSAVSNRSRRRFCNHFGKCAASGRRLRKCRPGAVPIRNYLSNRWRPGRDSNP